MINRRIIWLEEKNVGGRVILIFEVFMETRHEKTWKIDNQFMQLCKILALSVFKGMISIWILGVVVTSRWCAGVTKMGSQNFPTCLILSYCRVDIIGFIAPSGYPSCKRITENKVYFSEGEQMLLSLLARNAITLKLTLVIHLRNVSRRFKLL